MLNITGTESRQKGPNKKYKSSKYIILRPD